MMVFLLHKVLFWKSHLIGPCCLVLVGSMLKPLILDSPQWQSSPTPWPPRCVLRTFKLIDSTKQKSIFSVMFRKLLIFCLAKDNNFCCKACFTDGRVFTNYWYQLNSCDLRHHNTDPNTKNNVLWVGEDKVIWIFFVRTFLTRFYHVTFFAGPLWESGGWKIG